MPVSCLGSLARQAATVSRGIVPTLMATSAFFSTTAALAAAPGYRFAQGKGVKVVILPNGHIRGGAKLTLGGIKSKTRKKLTRGKAPLPGERKAWRKQLALSNDNAVTIQGLKSITADNMVCRDSCGTVMKLPERVQDQLRAIQAYKSTQTWNMFRQPSTLIRKETATVARGMRAARDAGATYRAVISGVRLSGKSTLLLQAIAHAYLSNWVVFHIPDAQELVTASTEYGPLPDTSPMQYAQPAYALRLMQAMRQANMALLSQLKTVLPHPELANYVPIGSSIRNLIDSAREVEQAWLVFEALWNELSIGGIGRPPILFALDGLAHIMRMSAYRTPAYDLIHSHDLALVRLFCECLSGARPLPNGGAAIAATSRNNAPRVASLDLVLSQHSARRSGQAVPQPDPYCRKYDARVEAVLESVDVVPVGPIDRSDARALMEYWAASGLLNQKVNEAAVTERWTLGGNGILGEMERATLLTMRL